MEFDCVAAALRETEQLRCALAQMHRHAEVIRLFIGLCIRTVRYCGLLVVEA